MKWRSRVAILLFALAVMGIGIWLPGYLLGVAGNSLSRIGRDHSLVLPSSATRAHCEGWVSLTWLGDFGAVADFIIDAADTNQVVQQISKIREGKEVKDRGINWDYRTPSEFGRELRYLEGRSKDGNFVTLTIYEADENRVGIVIRTQWN